MYRASTPRERERWHVRLWRMAAGPEPAPCLTRGMDGGGGRSGRWNGMPTLLVNGPRCLRRVVPGRCHLSSQEVPPPLTGEQQAELKTAVQELPRQAGIELSNWNWKAVRRFVEDRFGLALSRSSCLNYLHRLGICAEASQEAVAQGRPGAAGSLCGGVCRPHCGGPDGLEPRYSSLMRRTFRRMLICGASGC